MCTPTRDELLINPTGTPLTRPNHPPHTESKSESWAPQTDHSVCKHSHALPTACTVHPHHADKPLDNYHNNLTNNPTRMATHTRSTPVHSGPELSLSPETRPCLMTPISHSLHWACQIKPVRFHTNLAGCSQHKHQLCQLHQLHHRTGSPLPHGLKPEGQVQAEVEQGTRTPRSSRRR